MARTLGTIAALAAAMLLALALAAGCGKHQLAVGPEPPPGDASEYSATDTAGLEQKLIAEFHRLYPDAEKRPAELMDADATVVNDLIAELLTEDGQGQPLDPPRVRLTFTATNFADYNNDGAVNIADITPIAQRFGREYEDAPPAEELLSERTVLGHPDTRYNRLVAGADGGLSGKVDISDITPLAQNFNAELRGYNLYHAEVVDSLLTFSPVPLANLLGGDNELSVSLAEWADVEEADSGLSAGAAGRFVITLETAAPPPGEVYGYRAHAWGDGEEGPKGNVATVTTPSEEDTVPPYWLDTVGVTSTLALDEGVEVRWGAAYDAKSPPVHYRLYYSPGTTLDWGGATVVDDVASPYQVYGLTTLEPYTFAVRAYDSAEPSNLELNTVTRTDYAGPRDIYPPEWQTAVGVTNAVGTEDGFIVTWEQAVDSHDDGEMVWESGPVAYRIYWSTTTPIDFATADYVEVEGPAPDQPWQWHEFVGGFAHQTRYYFAVRAVDSAGYGRNEDANTTTLYGFIPEWSCHEVYRTVEEAGENRILLDHFEPYILLGDTRNYLVWSEHEDESEGQRHGFRIRLMDFHNGESELHTVLDTDTDPGYEGETGHIGSLEIRGDTLYFLMSTTPPGTIDSDFRLITWSPEAQSEILLVENEEAKTSSLSLTLKDGELYSASYGRPDDWWSPARYDQFIYYASEDFSYRHVLYSKDIGPEEDATPGGHIYLQSYAAWIPGDSLVHLDTRLWAAYTVIDHTGPHFVQDCWFRPETSYYCFQAVGEELPLLFIGGHDLSEKMPTPEYGLYEWDSDESVPFSVDEHPVWTQDTGDPCRYQGGPAFKSPIRRPLNAWQYKYPCIGAEEYAHYVIASMDGQLLKFRIPISSELRMSSVWIQFWVDNSMKLHVIVRAVEEPDAEDCVLIEYAPVDLNA